MFEKLFARNTASHKIVGTNGVWAIDEATFNEGYSMYGQHGIEGMNALAAVNRLAEETLRERLAFEGDDEEEEPAARSKPYYLTEDGIAIVLMEGVMQKKHTCMSAWFGGASTQETSIALRSAYTDWKRGKGVNSIAFVVDSPGGHVDGTAALSADVSFISSQMNLYTVVSGMAASACQWAICGSTKIFIGSSDLGGSLGTYMVVADSSERAAKEGVAVTVVRAGEFKGAGTPGTKITEPMFARWQREVDTLNAQFIGTVQKNRKLSDEKIKEIATGACFVGQECVDHGLADVVGTLDDALAELKALGKEGDDSNTNEKTGPKPDDSKNASDGGAKPVSNQNTLAGALGQEGNFMFNLKNRVASATAALSAAGLSGILFGNEKHGASMVAAANSLGFNSAEDLIAGFASLAATSDAYNTKIVGEYVRQYNRAHGQGKMDAQKALTMLGVSASGTLSTEQRDVIVGLTKDLKADGDDNLEDPDPDTDENSVEEDDEEEKETKPKPSGRTTKRQNVAKDIQDDASAIAAREKAENGDGSLSGLVDDILK